MSSTQTMKSWAMEIKTPEEIPRAFKEAFISLVPGNGNFPYTVYSPPYKFNKIKSNARLLLLLPGRLAVLTKIKSEVETVVFAFKDIDYMEQGSVLLSSWIRLEGMAMDRSHQAVWVGFNTVVDKLFLKFLETIRQTYLRNENGSREMEKDKFSYLADKNFKFMNYSKQSIRDGEEVKNNLFEPEIDVQNFRLFGRVFYKRISPAHLLILSDSEMIILKEPDSRKLSSYGASCSYIPLDKIESVTSIPDENSKYRSQIIKLKGGKVITLIYREERREELEELWPLAG